LLPYSLPINQLQPSRPKDAIDKPLHDGFDVNEINDFYIE